MFGNWLKGLAKKDKGHIRVRACVVLWAIWKVKNNFVFNSKSFPSFLQIIPMAIYWIHMWSYLHPADKLWILGATD
jgi:hypothetical protein